MAQEARIGHQKCSQQCEDKRSRPRRHLGVGSHVEGRVDPVRPNRLDSQQQEDPDAAGIAAVSTHAVPGHEQPLLVSTGLRLT